MSLPIVQSIPLSASNREFLYEELAIMAEKRAIGMDGEVSVLPFEDEYVQHTLTAYHIEGNRLPPDQIAAVANIATHGQFDGYQETFDKTETEHFALDSIASWLVRNNNVMVATNHRDLVDVAYAGLAAGNALSKRDVAFQNGIILGGVMRVLAFKVGDRQIPVLEALQMGYDDLFVTMPQTENMKKSGISRALPRYINRNNKSAKKAITLKLDTSTGYLMAIAPSGTADRVESSTSDCVLQPVSYGTAGMMTRPDTRVLPVAVWLGSEQPVFEVIDKPKQLHNGLDVCDVMSRFACHLQTKNLGLNFHYGGAAK